MILIDLLIMRQGIFTKILFNPDKCRSIMFTIINLINSMKVIPSCYLTYILNISTLNHKSHLDNSMAVLNDDHLVKI